MEPTCIIIILIACSTFLSLAPQYTQYIVGALHWMNRSCRKKNYRRRHISVTSNELSFYGICEYLSDRCTDLKEQVEMEKVLDWNNDGHPVQKKMVLPKPDTYLELKYLKVDEHGNTVEVSKCENENGIDIKVHDLRIYFHNRTNGTDIEEIEFEYHKDNTKYFHNSLKPIYIRMGISMESIMKSLDKADFTEDEKKYMEDMEKKRKELYEAKEEYYKEQKDERLTNIYLATTMITYKTNQIKLKKINTKILDLKKRKRELYENDNNNLEIDEQLLLLEENKNKLSYGQKIFEIKQNIKKLHEHNNIENSINLNIIINNEDELSQKITDLEQLNITIEGLL